MPSPYTSTYAGVLGRIKALGFETLVPGHGLVQRDSSGIDLLVETIELVSVQMKSIVAQGLSEEEAVAKVDFSRVEKRFTHGDAFLSNRFRDYVSDSALPAAAYSVETHKGPKEVF